MKKRERHEHSIVVPPDEYMEMVNESYSAFGKRNVSEYLRKLHRAWLERKKIILDLRERDKEYKQEHNIKSEPVNIEFGEETK